MTGEFGLDVDVDAVLEEESHIEGVNATGIMYAQEC